MLIALIDSAHVNHRPARKWFLANRTKGWATCPITENGLVRILSNPSYPGGAESAETTREVLTTICRQPGHTFWSDEVTIRNRRLFKSIAGSKQLTNSYLLALAVARRGKLVTLDRRINPESVIGGAEAILLIPAK